MEQTIVEVNVSESSLAKQTYQDVMGSIQKYITGKSLSFKWKQNTNETFTKIGIPSLTDSKYSSWADWGPMYSFIVDENELVRIEHKEESGEQLKYNIDNDRMLALNSPILANRREEHPFYYVINDNYKGVIYHVYMDRNGDPVQIAVLSLKDSSEIYNTTDIS